jgi:hypothetical protein
MWAQALKIISIYPCWSRLFVNGYDGGAGSNPIIFNNNQRAFVKENSVDDLSVPISNTLFKKQY